MTETLPIDVTQEPEKPQPGNSKALLAALRDHYIKPGDDWSGGVLLTEVQSPTSLRRADAVYLGFTSSRGYCIDVCELKVSKADFRRELDDPSKAEAWWPHSTRWWIVSPHPSVTPPEELPDGWGLMCPNPRGRRFKVVRQPEVREPRVDLGLLITLAKKLDNMRDLAVRQAVQEAQQQFYVAEEKLRRELRSTSDPATRERLRLLGELEEAAGITLADWTFYNKEEATPQQFGRALRRLIKVGQSEEDAARQAERLQRLISATRDSLDGLEKVAKALRSKPTDGRVA